MGSTTGSLEAGDAAAAAVQKTPNRVTLADLEANIAGEFFINAGEAAHVFDPATSRVGSLRAEIHSLNVLTICIIVTKNGFTLIGKSAPADANNFDETLGRKLAREDAIRQLWPLMGYALREKLLSA